MSIRVYISADYDSDSGDRNVVNELNKQGSDNYHKVDFVDMDCKGTKVPALTITSFCANEVIHANPKIRNKNIFFIMKKK